MLELNKIYNLDNMAGMAQIPDKYFELAIVDPPYGIGEDGRKNHTRSVLAKSVDFSKNRKYDNEIPSPEYFKELKRVSKNQIIWGGNYFIEHLTNTPCIIVWDKENGENDFADCELAWASFKTACRKFKYRWHGMLQGNMKQKEVRIHPNHKPIQLYKWLLKNYAKQGDKILDTHTGSASSIIACIDMGFDYMGFEIDKEYYDKSIERIKQFKSQPKISFEAPVQHSQSILF